MQRPLFIILFLMAFLCHSCGYRIAIDPPWKKSIAGNPVAFQKENYTMLLDSAKAHQLPVFIDFYTSWCAPCKVMDRDVFTESKLADFLNAQFVNIKIDAEKGEGRTLREQFQVTAYPTVVFINKNGQEAARYEGLMSASQVLRYAKRTTNSSK